MSEYLSSGIGVSQVISLKQRWEEASNIPQRNATKERDLIAILCMLASMCVDCICVRKGVLEWLDGEIEGICLNSQKTEGVPPQGGWTHQASNSEPTGVYPCVFVWVSSTEGTLEDVVFSSCICHCIVAFQVRINGNKRGIIEMQPAEKNKDKIKTDIEGPLEGDAMPKNMPAL